MKMEIPRSYVFYLENRVEYLETLLERKQIPFASAEELDPSSWPRKRDPLASTASGDEGPPYDRQDIGNSSAPGLTSQKDHEEQTRHRRSDKSSRLQSSINKASVQGIRDPRNLGSSSGISFAHVVFEAVKKSFNNPGTPSEPSSAKGGNTPNMVSKGAAAEGTTMRDSFFGLHTKPTITPAPFPDRELGWKLATLYLEHANPQIPILHRGEFVKMFDSAYASGGDRVRGSRELYLLNIVFAIGSGIILGGSDSNGGRRRNSGGPDLKRRRGSIGSTQCQPEEYHASALVHFETCLSMGAAADRRDGLGGSLEPLQAVLLLASFALLRPVAPGLWYIIGAAMRLAVDLGLHYEDGRDIDIGLDDPPNSADVDKDELRIHREKSAKERGRREWVRDFRRRLWWCTYSFDRLVSTCVGRPFGISDQAVSTEFPSLLEDKYITPAGFLKPPGGSAEASYKHVAHHYFRLRLLQSEILQVLQHQRAQQAHAGNVGQRNPYMHIQLPSPFLTNFATFRDWRFDMDQRLWHWKRSAPTKEQTGVAFSVEFLELNYYQAVIILYRQSVSVPAVFEGEFDTSAEVESPRPRGILQIFEDEERLYLKVARAGARVLWLYRSLHRVHLVNYTFLATHHLFMAGISFLFAIWQSPAVRSKLVSKSTLIWPF